MTTGVEAKNQKLLEILDKADDLPCIPFVALEVYKLCCQTNCKIDDIERLIKSDQAIAAKILRLVNSAYYGFDQEITGIKVAITILGVNGIKNLVMASATEGVYSYPGGEQLWGDSVEASFAIEGLFKYFKKPLEDDQFLTSLLHNIGRSIFTKYFYEDYKDLLGLRSLEEIIEREEEIFGINHKETGAILAKNWDLPQEVISGIQGNHASMSDLNLVDIALQLAYKDEVEIEESIELSQFTDLKEEMLERKSGIMA